MDQYMYVFFYLFMSRTCINRPIEIHHADGACYYEIDNNICLRKIQLLGVDLPQMTDVPLYCSEFQLLIVKQLVLQDNCSSYTIHYKLDRSEQISSTKLSLIA